MRKKVVTLFVLTLTAVCIAGCSNSTYQDDYEEMKKQVDEQAAEMQKEIDNQVDKLLNGSAETDTEQSEKQSESTVDNEQEQAKSDKTEKSEPTDTEETENKEISAGAHDIAGATFYFSKSVNNDVTGNWRISTVNTPMSAEGYATEYYKELFASDNEIHGIVNFALNTTSRITVFDSKTLDVSIMEYIDGEEHDAKELFSGMTLAEYFVNIETGEVEKIDE